MNKSNNRTETDEFLQLTGIADLLGKKSVRATFKLHPTAIQLLSVLASQLGIKQKSLFDYLMEEDALCQTLIAVISTYAKAYAQMKKRVNKGKQLSEFSIDALKRNQTNRSKVVDKIGKAVVDQ